MSDLRDLIEGTGPDEFITLCRDALRQVAAQMPTDQARLVYEHACQPVPGSTIEQHQDWLESHQRKAMQLDLIFRDAADA